MELKNILKVYTVLLAKCVAKEYFMVEMFYIRPGKLDYLFLITTHITPNTVLLFSAFIMLQFIVF